MLLVALHPRAFRRKHAVRQMVGSIFSAGGVGQGWKKPRKPAKKLARAKPPVTYCTTFATESGTSQSDKPNPTVVAIESVRHGSRKRPLRFLRAAFHSPSSRSMSGASSI